MTENQHKVSRKTEEVRIQKTFHLSELKDESCRAMGSLVKVSESLPFCERQKNLSNYCFEFLTKSLKQNNQHVFSGIIKEQELYSFLKMIRRRQNCIFSVPSYRISDLVDLTFVDELLHLVLKSALLK